MGDELQEFVYAASHDLQEPLRAIVAYAQLLDRHVASDPQAREYCGFVLDGAGKMKDLLQRLMLYSRAGSSKRHTCLNLNTALQRALLKLAPEIAVSQARIVSPPDLPNILGDEAELALLFENLLGNSLKFRSAEPPEITIAAEQGTDRCTVSVRDNGCGVDARFRQQIFLPFKRLHGKDIPGHGLGLAICEKIVQAHGGRIWMDEPPGANVRFTLATGS